MLDPALERLFKNNYQLWAVLRELRSAPPPRPSPDSLLREWRRAPRPSQEWRKALHYEQAVNVLSAALSAPREETEQLVRDHVFGRRLPVPAESHEDRL